MPSFGQSSPRRSSKYRNFSEKIEKTRGERILQQHEAYKSAWNKQMQLSIKARDTLEGQVNEDQQERDKTITEKVD